MGVAGLSGYLEGERAAGRLNGAVQPEILAMALLGGCLQHAFLIRVSGPEAVASGTQVPIGPQEYAQALVRTLLAGAVPEISEASGDR